MTRYWLVFVLIQFFAFGTQAHHSMTHFEQAFTEMEGTLVDITWRNPHVFFFLETEEANGEKKVWEMEAGTIYVLGRAGVTRDLFTIGERIRVVGNKSGVYDDKFWVENILTEAGNEIMVVLNGESRWNDEIVGGRGQWTNTAFIKDNEIIDRGEGIFRVWSPPADPSISTVLEGSATNRLDNIATEAGKASLASWDPYAFDDACELPGLPRVNFGPHPHQFIEDGDKILLLAEEFYVTRTIHMNSDMDPSQQPYSPVGFSVGEWQDENTLLVETTRINFPYMNLGGYGQSEDVRIRERYVLSEDESRLDYEVIVHDPAMLTTDYVQRGVWFNLGETVHETYDCVPKTALH